MLLLCELLALTSTERNYSSYAAQTFDELQRRFWWFESSFDYSWREEVDDDNTIFGQFFGEQCSIFKL